jgi:O-succinylbenzoate synthase
MLIDQVTLYHLRMKLNSPFETSFGRIETRDCILIEMQADGIKGYGECVADRDPGYSYETVGTAWHIYQDFMLPALLGTTLSQPADVQQILSTIRGHQMAKAGLEMALWDIYGKERGESLYAMLRGVRPKVEVGVSIGIQNSQEELLSTVNSYLEKGYRRVKLKIKPGKDVEQTSLVRQHYPDLNLQVDANSAYTLDSAKTLKPLDDLDLLLIEQPLADDDLWDHRQLQAEFETPICLDESIHCLRHARQSIEMKATRVINIKPGRVGGLSQGLAIHNLCHEKSIPVWCGGMLETGVGRAANLALASLPNFTLPGDISASERYYEQDITNEAFNLNPDSTIDVPDKPGLGVTIDRKALEKATLKKQTFK